MAGAGRFGKIRKGGAILGLAVALFVALPLSLGLVSAGEGRLYDLLLRTRSDTPDPSVLIVQIDDSSFKALGDHDPTRPEIAKVIGGLWKRGPSLIALDLLFTTTKGDGDDLPLEEALKKADCILACNPGSGLEPIERFRRQAVGLGSIDLVTDADGILRGMPGPYMDLGGDALKIQSMPMALECATLTWFPQGAPSARLANHTLWIGDHPLPAKGGLWRIPFCGGDGTIPRLSFGDVLRGGGPKDLKGKIVLIGNTRPSAHDYFSVPLPRRAQSEGHFVELPSNSMAGVEVHAQALSALLQGRSILPPSPATHWLLFGLLCLFGTALTMVPTKPLQALGIWSLAGLLLVAAAILAMRSGTALPLFALMLVWLSYAAASFSYHRYCDFQSRRAVEKLFGRYVSPNIAKRLLEDPSLVHPGGRKKTLTILFSDIRGFTSLSERLQPEQVTEILNLYFTEMMSILFAFDGTYDKFIGDALLAFFGDPVDQPDHSERALDCALAMQKKASELRTRFSNKGLLPLHIGIAVHAGPVVVGNHGSRDNWSYTVIGDTVNLASRLQGLAQHDDIIVSRSTAERVPGFASIYRYEELEPVRVKGKAQPVSILRVLGSAREEMRS